MLSPGNEDLLIFTAGRESAALATRGTVQRVGAVRTPCNFGGMRPW